MTMNWLEPEVTVAPTFEPVSLGEGRGHLRLGDDTSEDALVYSYLMAARGHLEVVTGVRFATQTVKFRADGFRATEFELARPPLQSVTQIQYVDTDGTTQALPTSVYAVYPYGLSPMIALKPGQSWPSTRAQPDAVTITAVVGYAQNALPDPLRQAILLLLGDWYRDRENTNIGNIVNELPNAVRSLIASFRVCPI